MYSNFRIRKFEIYERRSGLDYSVIVLLHLFVICAFLNIDNDLLLRSNFAFNVFLSDFIKKKMTKFYGT